MNKRTSIVIVGIIALLVVSMTVQFAKAKNVRQRAVSILLTYDNSFKTFKNNTYRFSFQYPNTLSVTEHSDDTNVTIMSGADKEVGHWIVNVTVEDNTAQRTLDAIFEETLSDTLMRRGNADYNIAVSDLLLGGKPAKRYSITNYGDWGNAGVVAMTEDAVVIISGDDSSDASTSDFNALLATFTFAEEAPSVTVNIQQCPDAWIDNQMPSIGNKTSANEYYIVDGTRREIDEFDAAWIAEYCVLTKQVVY